MISFCILHADNIQEQVNNTDRESLFSEYYENNMDEPQDPFEPINRFFFGINRVLDAIFLRPLAIIYDKWVPDVAQTGIGNFIDNFFSPVSCMNHALQGNGHEVAVSVWRFLINSTVGLLGIIDVAKELGLEGKKATFNQTLSSWGVDTGPYLMLPLFGPSTFRGACGSLGEWAMDPWTYVVRNKHRRGNHHGQQQMLYVGIYGIGLVRVRAQLLEALDDIERNSVNPYITIRSLYFQKQAEMKKQ